MWRGPRTIPTICAVACVLLGTSALRPITVEQPHGGFDSSFMRSIFREAEKQSNDLEEGVLVFFPGTSDKRINNVKKTIAWLQTQIVPVECIIYNYGKLSTPAAQLLPCRVIDNLGGKWMDHILALPLNLTKKKHVFHVLDGIEIKSIDLARMIKAMTENNLVHVAPALYGHYHYPTQQPHLGFGRKVNFLEYHIDLFTRENFACLQDLVDSKGPDSDVREGNRTTNNHYGWGVDFLMPLACPGKMGVIDAMKMRKFSGGSYDYEWAHIQEENWLYKEKNMSKQTLDDYDYWTEMPLKGNLLPGDPQCDGSPKCVCEDLLHKNWDPPC